MKLQVLDCFFLFQRLNFAPVEMEVSSIGFFFDVFDYIDNSVLMENRPLLKFIVYETTSSKPSRSDVFSISSIVRITMTPFLVFTIFCAKTLFSI